MLEGRNTTFGGWQVGWLVVTSATAALAWTALPTFVSRLELTFLVWFVGFLVGVELFAPRHVAPETWGRARWFVGAGVLVSVVLVARRILVLVA